MTVGEFRRDCAKSIGTFAPEEAHVLCDILLANVLGCDRSALLLSLDRKMETEDARRMAEAVSELSLGVPVQYIVGSCWFYNREIKVGSGCFIPRGDTEFLAAAAVAALPEGGSFADVDSGAYYADAVAWAVEQGITSGTGNGKFSPDSSCTRAQMVTFLWRAAGSPEPKAMSSFADVSTDAYYAKAVAWAVENGITTGTGDGKFSPDATCTRAQSVTFLFRAIGKLVDSKAEFSDVLTDSYYANAVAWAVENGVTNGIGDGLFGPDNSCTRAQIVTFLFRAYQGK